MSRAFDSIAFMEEALRDREKEVAKLKKEIAKAKEKQHATKSPYYIEIGKSRVRLSFDYSSCTEMTRGNTSTDHYSLAKGDMCMFTVKEDGTVDHAIKINLSNIVVVHNAGTFKLKQLDSGSTRYLTLPVGVQIRCNQTDKSTNEWYVDAVEQHSSAGD